MRSRMFRSWPTMLCGTISQHARSYSRAHLVPRTSFCISSGGGGVKPKPNTETSSTTRLMHETHLLHKRWWGLVLTRMLHSWASSSPLLHLPFHLPTGKQPVLKYDLKMPGRPCWWTFCIRPLLFFPNTELTAWCDSNVASLPFSCLKPVLPDWPEHLHRWTIPNHPGKSNLSQGTRYNPPLSHVVLLCIHLLSVSVAIKLQSDATIWQPCLPTHPLRPSASDGGQLTPSALHLCGSLSKAQSNWGTETLDVRVVLHF